MGKFSKILSVILLGVLTGCSLYKPTLAVNDITKKALNLEDVSMCTSLQDSKAKDYCKGLVSDSMLVNQATSRADATVCIQVRDPEYKKACELGATSAARKKEADIKEIADLLKLQQGTSVEACNVLSDSTRKNQCIMNVANSQAILNHDAKLCDPIQDLNIRKICKDSVR